MPDFMPSSSKKPDKSNTNLTPPLVSPLVWEMFAVLAVCLILTTPFLYKYRISNTANIDKEVVNDFSGTLSCKECHLNMYNKWKGSDHDLAMAPATESSVLADFGNVIFTDPYSNLQSRFFKENGNFLVETEGPDGERGTFSISHTFGFYPLQQYLVPFPGGRLQCLSIAWDVEKKQWYRLPPYEVKGHDDWLHWTKGGQTWNGMCAECHSTRLQKSFDRETESYSTTWFEINVGCEACHGPASKHIEWAKRPALARAKIGNYGLTVTTNNLSPEKQIVICAPCHSRRYQLGDNKHEEGELLDVMVPTLLTEELYHADGQIKEEVYVYGSFVQSKMYSKGVRCSDCHDMHSLKPFQSGWQGNDLCLQCHRAADYDTRKHHFHKKMADGKPSKGFLCVKCHMPGQEYMGIDYRPDHSLRIPRPDLSEKLKTPNGCSTRDCHGDRPLSWVNDSYTKWYGESRKSHYGEAIAAGRAFEQGGDAQLTAIAKDELLPAIVRATALSLLRNYPEPNNIKTIVAALESREAVIRHTALRALQQSDEETILQRIAPKLYDPVKAVRLEASVLLASVPLDNIKEQDREQLQKTLEEYRLAMEYNGDFAPQRYNLGNLERALGNSDKAISFYKAAIAIDKEFIPAKVNLAMEYNQAGKNQEAEQLLRDVVALEPRLYEINYSLGLLLSEQGKLEEAVRFLGTAADGMPAYSRVRYNHALALLKLKRWQEGADSLEKAIMQDPHVEEYFVTLANLYLNFRMIEKVRRLAQDVLKLVPNHQSAIELIQRTNQNSQ